jgi:NtrC-family two-component system sensor histidine kinase KinB
VPTDNDNKMADGDNKGGSGLGLAISKEIIEAQDGEIWVESVLGKGSIFSFSLKQSI